MPKERHRANKKNHKHSPSKVFAHGVIKITILTTKDGPKLKLLIDLHPECHKI